MSSTINQETQINPRIPRRTRQRTPFGDEDVQVVFAGLGISSIFQRRIGLSKGTAVLYHQDMLKHANQLHQIYPECSNRLKAVYDRCEQTGLLARCLTLQPQLASDEMLRLAHSSEYIDQVTATATMNDHDREVFIRKFDCASFNKDTNQAARLAVGALTQAVDVVMRGDVRNAMCLVRPPGHHAMADEACGFCVFNNIAIAAKYAVDSAGANRVLIVDWDVHHGQGTQYAFYNDPKVLYFSIHRYDDGLFWPNLRESNFDFVGEGRAYGYNVNVPLEGVSYTDNDYLTIFNCLLMPIAYEFDPDLILVSAGFDCALGCPIGCFSLTPAVFAHLTHRLMALADGKLIVSMEGGYNPASLSDSVAHTVASLLGDPLPSLKPLVPIRSGTVASIRSCVSVLRTKWKSLNVFPFGEVQPLKDMSGLSRSSWKEVMKPDADVEAMGLSPEQVQTANAELDILRHHHNFQSVSDLSRVCLVYDSRMENHKNEQERNQPECPARLRRAYELLEEYGLQRRCKRTEARIATREELLRVHTAEYIDTIEKTATLPLEELNTFAEQYDSVYFNKHSFDSASLAVGSLLSVVDNVCNGETLHGVAVIRPPGHHAEKDQCSGFCLFNNVALAAKHAQAVHQRKRIAIIDWDVHHGNGIQHVFEEDPEVLYVSLHRFDDGRYFPGSFDASAETCGVGRGLGTTVNLPWFGRPVRDGDYLAAFNNFVLPLLYEFRPELIIVAAGFDAVRGDHLGGLGVSPECFGHLTHLLTSVSNLNPCSSDESSSGRSRTGGIVLALEGGYNLAMTAEALSQCVGSLLGDTCLRLASGMVPTEKSGKAIRRAFTAQKPHWKCLFDYSPIDCFCNPETLTRLRLANAAAAAATAASAEDESNMVNFGFISVNSAPEELPRSQTTSESITLTPSRVEPGEGQPDPLILNPRVLNIASRSSVEAGGRHANAVAVEANLTMTMQAVTLTTTVSSQDEVNYSRDSPVVSTPSQHREPGSINEAASISSSSYQALPGSSHGANREEEGRDVRRLDMNVMDPTTLQTLVHFANAGIDDLPSFFGLSSSDPMPERVFAVEPILWCEHLDAVTSARSWQPDINLPCIRCDNRIENWVCLTCYQVYCGRYSHGHMLEHHSATQHPIVLSFADLSVWCYSCNSYVHNEVLIEAKRAAHMAKFGQPLTV